MNELKDMVSMWSLESTLVDLNEQLTALNLEVDSAKIPPSPLEPGSCSVCKIPPKYTEKYPSGWWNEDQCSTCNLWDMGQGWLMMRTEQDLERWKVWVCNFPGDPSICYRQFYCRSDAMQYGKLMEQFDSTLKMRLQFIVPLQTPLEKAWKGHYIRESAVMAVYNTLSDRGIEMDTATINTQILPETWTQYLMDCKTAFKRDWSPDDTEHIWWLVACKELRPELEKKEWFRTLLAAKRYRVAIWIPNFESAFPGRPTIRRIGQTDESLWHEYINKGASGPRRGESCQPITDEFRKRCRTYKFEDGQVIVRRGAFHWVPQLAHETPRENKQRAGRLKTVMGSIYKTQIPNVTPGVARDPRFYKTPLIEYRQLPWETMEKFVKRVDRSPGILAEETRQLRAVREQRIRVEKGWGRKSLMRRYLEQDEIHPEMTLRDDAKMT